MSTLWVCPKCKQLNRVNLSQVGSRVPLCGTCSSVLEVKEPIQNLDLTSLEKLIRRAELPVIVDFWAPWCGPCKTFAPTFELASNKHFNNIQFVKINTEEFPESGQRFQVRGIPTLIIFKQGQEVARTSGALPLAHLEDFIIPWTNKNNTKGRVL